MTDPKSQVKNGQMYPHNALSKPPIAINLATKSTELEDDLEALKLKQANKVNRSLTNASPSPEGRDKSPTQRHPSNPVNADISPKRGQPDRSKSPVRAATAINREGATTFDPHEELKTGKSEEEVLAKLKSENTKLRKELKGISETLTSLVDQKRNEKKEEIHPPHARDIIANTVSSEKDLQLELESAQKQLTRLQKEIAQLNSKYESHGTYEKYQVRQQHLYDIENKITDMQNQKKTMDKTVREKEKVLDGLLIQSGHNVEVISMDEEARLYREKAREADKKKDFLEKQAQKRKEYTDKLIADLETLKQDFKRIQEKTGYEHKEKPKDNSFTSGKLDKSIEMRPTKKIPMFKQVEEELPCTAENFEKLKKELKILQKAEDMKGKKNERETGTYQAQITSLEKNKEEASNKMAEKAKEIDLLATKLKDLSRIVRHQAVVPLHEELIVKELPDQVGKRHSSPGQRSRSSSRGKKEKNPKRPQPHNMLLEYAKHNFQSKGYRKDEKGKPVREGEGINFNDRDVVGKQKVKIIAVDMWYDDTCITGIQVVYENEEKKVIEGHKHILNEEKSKKTTFETLEEDYLKEISGFMNRSETVIECLIMKTFRGETMRVGAPNRDSKLFKFDINEMEYPAVIYGSLKDEKNTAGRLSRLGVLISSQTIEEKIEAKEVKEGKETKNEQEASPSDKNLEKSQEIKDSGDVVEEIEAHDTDRHNKERIEGKKSHRKTAQNSPREDQDHAIEEAIDGGESKRSRKEQGSPRK